MSGVDRARGPVRSVTGAMVAVLLIAAPPSAAAQTAATATGTPPPPSAFDTASLASGPQARGCMLLERTLFQVDVLTMELRLGPETAAEVRRLVETGASRDSIARAALRSRNAYARIEFVRDVGMDRFIDGVRSDLRKVAEAGLIDQPTLRRISDSLPRWYAFLAERGVRAGDALLYRVRGDTLHSGYRDPSGEWLLRQTDVGPERRRAVLGSYLVDGSSFREGLLDSLIRGDDDC